MRKFLKAILLIVILLIIVAGAFALYINFRSMPHYAVQEPTIQVEVTSQRVASGHKLASMLCFNCHYNTATEKFSGRELTEAPQFGKIYSANITQDKNAGIGKWTDGQIIYFIRTGLKPTGEYVPPYMPKLAHIADEDMYSIIAFLRSDDPWVQANTTPSKKLVPSFLTKFLLTIKAFKPFDFPKETIPLPDTTNKVAWGKYIALYQYECFACHSKDFSTNNYNFPEKSAGFFGGGNEMHQMNGAEIYSQNITPDPETGIGKLSEEDFAKALRTGVLPNGQGELHYPMVQYSGLSDGEVSSIYAYLKTVPPIKNKVERNFAK